MTVKKRERRKHSCAGRPGDKNAAPIGQKDPRGFSRGSKDFNFPFRYPGLSETSIAESLCIRRENRGAVSEMLAKCLEMRPEFLSWRDNVNSRRVDRGFVNDKEFLKTVQANDFGAPDGEYGKPSDQLTQQERDKTIQEKTATWFYCRLAWEIERHLEANYDARPDDMKEALMDTLPSPKLIFDSTSDAYWCLILRIVQFCSKGTGKAVSSMFSVKRFEGIEPKWPALTAALDAFRQRGDED